MPRDAVSEAFVVDCDVAVEEEHDDVGDGTLTVNADADLFVPRFWFDSVDWSSIRCALVDVVVVVLHAVYGEELEDCDG